MASDVVKREFAVSYTAGKLGSVTYILFARSADEIRGRYPLFDVFELDQAHWLTPREVRFLRAFPGPGRPLDAAIVHLLPAERDSIARELSTERKAVLVRLRRGEHSAEFIEQAMAKQYWVDLDDDAEFRMQMHELWKGDMRYRELPPERRLF